MKRCGACQRDLPLSSFHRRGLGHQTWCKSCRKTYDAAYNGRNRLRRSAQKRRYHADFMTWCDSLKADTPCADCRGVFSPRAMQWDHLPGFDKVDDIGNLSRRHNRRRIIEEIAKCELVCANCHAVRTLTRRGA